MSKIISAKEFDMLFDEGGDITPFLNQSSRRGVSDFFLKETKKVTVDFNLRQLTDVDKEAEYLGINRPYSSLSGSRKKLGSSCKNQTMLTLRYSALSKPKITSVGDILLIVW